MTITLNLQADTVLKDLQTLQHIFEANSPDIVASLKTSLDPLTISSTPHSVGNIEIQVTPVEFSLIGIFNSGTI